MYKQGKVTLKTYLITNHTPEQVNNTIRNWCQNIYAGVEDVSFFEESVSRMDVNPQRYYSNATG